MREADPLRPLVQRCLDLAEEAAREAPDDPEVVRLRAWLEDLLGFMRLFDRAVSLLARAETDQIATGFNVLARMSDGSIDRLLELFGSLPEDDLAATLEAVSRVSPGVARKILGAANRLAAREPGAEMLQRCRPQTPSILLAGDRLAELQLGHPRSAPDLQLGRAIQELLARVADHVYAARGRQLTAPRPNAADLGPGVRWPFLRLGLPVVVHLFEGVLERGKRRAVRLLAFTVLLDGAVVRLDECPLRLRGRALERARKAVAYLVQFGMLALVVADAATRSHATTVSQ